VTDEELVDHLYELVLRREPEPEARARTLAKLAEGTLSRATLLHELVTSEEFERVRVLDDAIAFARWARGANERPRELRAPAGTDERAIEIPWTLARYRDEPRVLDAGYAFAEQAWLAALAPFGPVGVDLAEADVPGYRTVRADLRSLPFEDDAFDVAFCISTLEHVGRDNTVYGLAAEDDPDGMPAALRELRRVVAGRLLITVPTGAREERDWLVQLEPESWLDLFRATGFLVFEHEVYALSQLGWAAAGETPSVPFGESSANAVLCAELHPATAARRAREAVRRLRRR
jgi:hypothetical protein